MILRPELTIFDLDGTLLDTRTDLAHAVNYALHELGKATHSTEQVVRFIGNGSLNLVRRALDKDQTDEEVQKAHELFMEYYQEHCTDHVQPYAGVLEGMQSSGRIALLTNKPIQPTWKLLKHFQWESRFEKVLGGDTTPARKPAPEGLLSILNDCGVAPQKALMVGDDLPDLQAARAAGVPVAILQSGFGQPQDWETLQPDYLCRDFNHLIEKVLLS